MNKFLLLLIFLIVKSLYIPLNKRKSKYYWKIKFDNHIPLIPIFSIPYIGYYPYIIMTIILLWNSKYINIFFITYIFISVLASIFWFFIPNGVKRPKINNNDIFSKITRYIHKFDGDTNGFPSAHIYATLICSYFLLILFPEYSLIIWTINLLICASTILIKQHYILDILGGIIFFLIGISITNIFLTV